MKKWIGWIGFFVVVILLAVGGFFLLPLLISMTQIKSSGVIRFSEISCHMFDINNSSRKNQRRLA